MSIRKFGVIVAGLISLASTAAQAEYWSLFNEEGEAAVSAQYVTYGSLTDMLDDKNRLGIFTPDQFGAGANIVDGGSNGSTYWSLFNEEGEAGFSAQFVTYTSLADMLADNNRIGIFTPDTFGVGANIVGSGTDGSTYWNLFNEEGEASFSAQFVTYASLGDMLADNNRLGVFTPDTLGAGANIVDSGSDGSTYWSLFNEEGESAFSAQFVTYSSLVDMLNDTNRRGVFTPDFYGAGANIVGSGSDSFPGAPSAAPEPATWATFIGGFGLIGCAMRRRRQSGVRFARSK